FERYYHKGMDWYRSHFPCMRGLQDDPRYHSCDASPSSCFHPHAARRAYQLLPHAKSIILLRNPVDRAISQYYWMCKLDRESRPLAEALEREEERLQGEDEKLARDELYYSYNLDSFSYVKRGMYLNQIQNWLCYFPREQLLILKSEDLYRDARGTCK